MKITYKGEVDLVTQADRRSEQAIVTRLRTYFPKHAIVAEEGGGYETDSPFRWFVDPLDGTTNFAHGYPCFAVSMGLEEAGELGGEAHPAFLRSIPAAHADRMAEDAYLAQIRTLWAAATDSSVWNIIEQKALPLAEGRAERRGGTLTLRFTGGGRRTYENH